MAVGSVNAKLTQKQIEALKPGDKRREISDGAGIYLIIQPKGARSWAVRYRHEGRLLKLTLGPYPRLGLGDARKLARKALAAVDAGADPQGEKRAARRAARVAVDSKHDNFETAVAAFLASAKREFRPNSQKQAAQILGGLAARWRGRKLAEITDCGVCAAIDEILNRGHGPMANRTLSWTHVFYAWCIKPPRKLVAVNPCAGVEKPHEETSRDKVLTDKELLALWRAAEALGGAGGRMAQLLILTGQRLREVAQLQWSEVDLDAALWTLPAARAKNNKEHVIPLAPAAIEILKGAPRFENCGFVFSVDGARPIAGFASLKARLDAALPGMAAWTFHDLRRTFASGCAGLGVAIHVVEKLLNHRSGTFGGIVGVYQKFDFASEQRAAAEAWARHIEVLLSGPADNVVSLRRPT